MFGCVYMSMCVLWLYVCMCVYGCSYSVWLLVMLLSVKGILIQNHYGHYNYTYVICVMYSFKQKHVTVHVAMLNVVNIINYVTSALYTQLDN